jgi:hypothetical protein
MKRGGNEASFIRSFKSKRGLKTRRQRRRKQFWHSLTDSAFEKGKSLGRNGSQPTTEAERMKNGFS